MYIWHINNSYTGPADQPKLICAINDCNWLVPTWQSFEAASA